MEVFIASIFIYEDYIMKVKISNYRTRLVSNIHDNYMHKKYGRYEWEDNTTSFENFLEKVEDALQWVYNKTINRILNNMDGQKVVVQIDSWDTWSMDHTLSHIIAPMLKQLKKTKHGAPWVYDEDVPEELRSTNAEPKENDWDVDSNHFKRWDWALDEMIWAFEQKSRDDWEGDYYEYENDPDELFGLKLVWEDKEGRKAHQERMNNGFKLFGKYYEGLWD